jgi:hypothetical protein
MQSFTRLRMCLVPSQFCWASFFWIWNRRRRHYWQTSRASLRAARLSRRLTMPFLPLPRCQRSSSWHVLSWFSATACTPRFHPPTTAPLPSWSGPVIFSNCRWDRGQTRCWSTTSSLAGLPSPSLLAAVAPPLLHRLPSLRRRLSPQRNQFRTVPATSHLPSLRLSRTCAPHPLSTLPAALPAQSGNLSVIPPSKYICVFILE